MNCKNCKYWTRQKSENFGYCSSSKLGYGCPITKGDEVSYTDIECYGAVLELGENFGCIHFEKA